VHRVTKAALVEALRLTCEAPSWNWFMASTLRSPWSRPPDRVADRSHGLHGEASEPEPATAL